MKGLMLRLSAQEDEIKKLKKHNENLDKECLKQTRKLAELEVLNEKNRDSMAEIRQAQYKSEEPEKKKKDSNHDDNPTELEQLKVLLDFKNRGFDRVSPLEKPIPKKPVPRCEICKIDFVSMRTLDEHVSQLHPKNSVPESKMNEHRGESEKSSEKIFPPRENISPRPAGIVRRQYNCHECDYQGHRSKALFNHSIESGHRKIDSLEETCYTCRQTFENFIVLMKHRKASHYDTISECHRFRSAGECQFKERCFYRHTNAQNVPLRGQNNSFPPSIQNVPLRVQNDSFPQGQEEFPPDLRQLTLGFQSLMSTFLSNREKQGSRQPGS